MSTASTSGSFDITLLVDPAGTGNWTIANLGSGGFPPGRTFRVMQALVSCTGLAALTVEVRKNTGAGALCATFTSAGATTDSPATLTEANTTFAATDNIYVSAVDGGLGANLTKVILRCVAADAQALTVT